MAKFQWRTTALVSLVAAYFIVSRQASWAISKLISTALGLWILQGFAFGIWIVILYPKFFSPLRGLPEPEGGSLLMGHFKKIRDLPTGYPMREW